ncbi:MAG: type II toxin-antitoxin system HicB family antitoxin [Chloroflexi bacterium]|nr:type II toxin-antitoxin system HicB family antitoxin [Chloroflexota bacterium]
MSAPLTKPRGRRQVRSYLFRVVIEPDEDRWHAYCPFLERYGAATWGYTEEAALKNIREVVEMVIDELKEDKDRIPEEPEGEVQVFAGPRAMVTV